MRFDRAAPTFFSAICVAATVIFWLYSMSPDPSVIRHSIARPSARSARARRSLLHPPVKIACAAAPSGHARIGVDELVCGELVDDAGLRLALPIRE
jgi:hypothetical protein